MLSTEEGWRRPPSLWPVRSTGSLLPAVRERQGNDSLAHRFCAWPRTPSAVATTALRRTWSVVLRR